MRALILAAAVSLSTVSIASSQLSLSSFTIDGGGGTSIQGFTDRFELTGTIGQYDAGTTTIGGTFSNRLELTGGFWTPPIIPGPHPTYANSGQAWSVGETIQAENFDTGTSASHDIHYSPSEPGSEPYRTGDVDLQATGDTGGGLNIGWTQPEEYTEYTIDVPEDGFYTVAVRVASNTTGATFRLEFDGENRSGSVSFPATGGWQSYVTVNVPDVALTAGVQKMRIHWETNGANLNWIYVERAQPVITSLVPNPDDTITATWESRAGEHYTYSASTNLVDWIEIDDAVDSEGISTSFTFNLIEFGLGLPNRLFIRVSRNN